MYLCGVSVVCVVGLDIRSSTKKLSVALVSMASGVWETLHISGLISSFMHKHVIENLPIH